MTAGRSFLSAATLAVAVVLAAGVAAGQITLPRRGGSNSKTSKDQPNLPSSTTTGMVRKLDADWLVMQADDHRIVSFRLNQKTVIQKQGKDAKISDFRPGDHITVDANESDQGQLIAVTISFEKAGTNGEYAKASRPVEDAPIPVRQAERNGGGSGDPDDEKPRLRRAGAKDKEDAKPEQQTASASTSKEEDAEPAVRERPTTVVQDADDKEMARPRVRRGIPPPRPQESEPETQVAEARVPQTPAVASNRPPEEGARRTATPAAASAVAERGEDPFIEKTREAIQHFSEGLPSYIVQQLTTRYQSTTPKADFRAQDVVSADVVYEGGQEKYKNIKVNNKVSKKSMEDLGGSWSTGEFATTIQDVFSPASHADFRFRRNQTTSNRPARVYDYKVDRENSHWTVLTTSQSYKPAYKGRVWLDQETNLVLRLEMEAIGLPQEFPLDHVEMTLDYDFVRLSGNSFLLPVMSENLSCQRGTSYCSKNTMEFRNYKKYSSESAITYTP